MKGKKRASQAGTLNEQGSVITKVAEGSLVYTSPLITFNDEDLDEVCLPHNGALLITLGIAWIDIRRVLVDPGVSVNALFLDTYY